VKIIGISGVDGTMDFKRRHWPGLEEREYRISQGHDSAAALVIDGEFVAGVAEERISRKKHTGAFPIGAIHSCLDQAGLDVQDVDAIVHGFDYAPYYAVYALDPVSAEQYKEVLSREAFVNRVRRHLPDYPAERVGHVDHHLAHAASAYFTSGWDECLVVVIDGMAEAHGATVYTARDGKLEVVRRITSADSIGVLYSVITLHLGFDFNSDEYKIMGLAPYGDPDRFRGFFDEAVQLNDDGTWGIPPLRLNGTRDDVETQARVRRHLAERLVPARVPDSEITDDHRDAAAALQACLDRIILHICGHYGKTLGMRRLAMAGGVALNTTANGRLLQSGLYDEIYVQPAAADDGSALGAALWRAAEAGEIVNQRSPVPFYGPAHPMERIDKALSEHTDRIEVTRLPSLEAACDAAAGFVAAGEVVCWYRGRMEFGPRALGHRSIIADPGRADMRDRVNAMVKMREAFRPFAPAVAIEEVDRWFDAAPGTELPYMIVNLNVRPEHREALPAITHVDGSARVQTVSREGNPDFHALLEAAGRHTGKRMLLNTSFNVKGQPIVNTPEEAIETFLMTGTQALFLENVLVRKR
jgi:carbamoyltransferase